MAKYALTALLLLALAALTSAQTITPLASLTTYSEGEYFADETAVNEMICGPGMYFRETTGDCVETNSWIFSLLSVNFGTPRISTLSVAAIEPKYNAVLGEQCGLVLDRKVSCAANLVCAKMKNSTAGQCVPKAGQCDQRLNLAVMQLKLCYSPAGGYCNEKLSGSGPILACIPGNGLTCAKKFGDSHSYCVKSSMLKSVSPTTTLPKKQSCGWTQIWTGTKCQTFFVWPW